LEEWSKSKNKNTRWIIKHALRNEIKRENPQTIKILKDIE
jgi:3-methyladenine DNA glycosylase AlkC